MRSALLRGRNHVELGSFVDVLLRLQEDRAVRVVVVMEHTAKGKPKLLKQCTLPLTGTHVVDLVITDLGVFEIDKKGMVFARIDRKRKLPVTTLLRALPAEDPSTGFALDTSTNENSPSWLRPTAICEGRSSRPSRA